MSDRTSLPPFPWVYAYIEEPVKENFPREKLAVALRPAIQVALAGPFGPTNMVYGLVDSGAEHTYAAPWMPQTVGVTPDPDTEIFVGIAGGERRVRFADTTVRLMAPGGVEDIFFEWVAPVGFLMDWEPPWMMLLGQRGFFDEFTVSLRRPVLAVEHKHVFDERFPEGG
jgi:hypothetical protein